MILLAILLIGIILVIRQRYAFYPDSRPAAEAQLILGIFLIVFTIIFFLIITYVIPSDLNSLRAEQKVLLALRECRDSNVEGSEYLLEALDYQKRVCRFNAQVLFWKKFLKKHPNFVSSSWVLPLSHSIRERITEQIVELKIISP